MPETISDAGRTYLAWALTDGVGPILFRRIVERCGSPERGLTAARGTLEDIRGIGRERAERIVASRGSTACAAEIAAAAEHGVRIVCQVDPEYPPGLLRIPDAPIVLFVRGELRPTDAVAVAIVGSRRCSIYGADQARRFGELLARAGFTVISGLARGIDSFAHHGAVDAGGRSIAIMGRGLDDIYPPQNRALAERLLQHGAWISEHPVRTAVRAESFPSRNRIIAGMSLGTLVVEAAARSGALITARLASEYNREVFAVPGRVNESSAIGVNGLIRDGAAKLVMGLEDILSELGEVGKALTRADSGSVEPSRPTVPVAAAREAAGQDEAVQAPEPAPTAAPAAGLSTLQRRVLAHLGADPAQPDDLVRALDAAPAEVLAALTELELLGLVRRLPGQRVVKSRGI